MLNTLTPLNIPNPDEQGPSQHGTDPKPDRNAKQPGQQPGSQSGDESGPGGNQQRPGPGHDPRGRTSAETQHSDSGVPSTRDNSPEGTTGSSSSTSGLTCEDAETCATGAPHSTRTPTSPAAPTQTEAPDSSGVPSSPEQDSPAPGTSIDQGANGTSSTN